MDGEVRVVYAGEPTPSSWHAAIFLAGPTPRDEETPSWRPEALELLRQAWSHPGTLVVFVPEPRDGSRWPSYVDQVAWEHTHTDIADVVLFWVAREMTRMPALNTNVEFGRYENSGRVVLGVPPNAFRVRYLEHFARWHGAAVCDRLQATVEAALRIVGAGAPREGGRRDVPLLVWRTPSFQAWLAAQEGAGNTLLGGRLIWTLRPESNEPFYWALRARVHVAAEDRVKDNEVVLSRPDLATVMAYRPAQDPLDSLVVLIREFRTPSSTVDGFVRELPGGSGTALDELREETGLDIEAGRLRFHLARQPVATLSAHRQHVFSVRLTDDELALMRESTAARGNAEDGERTYVEVARVGDLLRGGQVDWTTLGIIFQVLTDPA